MNPISAKALAHLQAPLKDSDEVATQELKCRLLDGILAIFGGVAATSPDELAAIQSCVVGDGQIRPVVPLRGPRSVEAAAFINGFLIRQADWGDSYVVNGSAKGHPSDQIAAVLALSDTPDVSGRKLLELVHLAYRLWASLSQAMPELPTAGWDYTTSASLSIPIIAAVRYGHDLERLNNAVRLSASGGGVLAQVRGGEVTNWKSGATGYSLARSLWIYRMSSAFEAPDSMFHGTRGWNRLVTPLHEDTLDNTVIESAEIFADIEPKMHPCFHIAQSAVSCAMQLHQRINEPLDSVVRIRVMLSEKGERIANRPGRSRYPQDDGAARQNVLYCTVAALVYGKLMPLRLERHSPGYARVRRLMEVAHVERFEANDPTDHEACRIDIEFEEGRTVSEVMERSAGYLRDLSATERLARLQDVVDYKRNLIETAWDCDLRVLMDVMSELERYDGAALLAAVHNTVRRNMASSS